MHFLPIKPAVAADGIIFSDYDQKLDWSSPAVDAMVDFRTRKPRTIRDDCAAEQAERAMLQERDTLRFVLGHKGELAGVITLEDVCAQRVMQLVAGGLEREDILVKHLMQPKDSLRTLSYAKLQNSTVEDIAFSLKRVGAQHCLIKDDRTGRVLGFVAADELSRLLGVGLHIHARPTFATLVHELRV